MTSTRGGEQCCDWSESVFRSADKVFHAALAFSITGNDKISIKGEKAICSCLGHLLIVTGAVPISMTVSRYLFNISVVPVVLASEVVSHLVRVRVVVEAAQFHDGVSVLRVAVEPASGRCAPTSREYKTWTRRSVRTARRV